MRLVTSDNFMRADEARYFAYLMTPDMSLYISDQPCSKQWSAHYRSCDENGRQWKKSLILIPDSRTRDAMTRLDAMWTEVNTPEGNRVKTCVDLDEPRSCKLWQRDHFKLTEGN